MTKQKILLIGATGFAGNHVMQKLNNDFEVITLSRSLPSNLSNNTKNIIFDFYNLDNQTELPKSDHIILCIGTPLKLWELIYVKNKDIHWIRPDLKISNGSSLSVCARIRYRQPLQKACLYKVENGLYVNFLNLQTAITDGQFVAWYIGEELVGSGVIS